MSTTDKIRVLLADDHQIMRQGLSLMIREASDLELVGEAEDGMTAVELARSEKPDVLVTDLMIPRLHGLEVVKQVCRELKKTKVLVLSTYSDDPLVKEALHNGAAGYLLKECSSNDFLEALRTVAQGRRYLSRSIADRIVDTVAQGKDANETDIYDTLTSRERLVLRLAAEGNSTPQIAKKLFISPRTAETHRANLMRKLAFNSQTDLVRFAIRKGIISP